MGTMLVLLKGVPYGNLIQWPTAISLQKHFNAVLKAVLYLFPKASRSLLAAGDFCTEATPVTAKGDGKGFGTAGYNALGMCWGEVLGQGGVVNYCSSFALFEQREAS